MRITTGNISFNKHVILKYYKKCTLCYIKKKTNYLSETSVYFFSLYLVLHLSCLSNSVYNYINMLFGGIGIYTRSYSAVENGRILQIKRTFLIFLRFIYILLSVITLHSSSYNSNLLVYYNESKTITSFSILREFKNISITVNKFFMQKTYFYIFIRKFYSSVFRKLLSEWMHARRKKYFIELVLNRYLCNYRVCTLIYNNSYKNVFLTLLSDKGKVLHTTSSGCIGFIGKKRTYERTIQNLTRYFLMDVSSKMKGYISNFIVSTRGSLLYWKSFLVGLLKYIKKHNSNRRDTIIKRDIKRNILFLHMWIKSVVTEAITSTGLYVKTKTLLFVVKVLSKLISKWMYKKKHFIRLLFFEYIYKKPFIR